MLSPCVSRWHCMTSACETVRLAVQDFNRAREHVMMLASVDDDDGDDCVCASGCVCTVSVWWISISQMAGSPRDGVCEPSPPAWGFCCLRLPTKVTVSRKADRTGNEFNISSADSCNLIVTLWNRYSTFKEKETVALSCWLSCECPKSLGFSKSRRTILLMGFVDVWWAFYFTEFPRDPYRNSQSQFESI